MTFRIRALPVAACESLFGWPDDELVARGAMRRRVNAVLGYPCRPSRADARPSARVPPLDDAHAVACTPYRASHAIFVCAGAVQSRPAPGQSLLALARRLLSVCAFDPAHMMAQADADDGSLLAPQLAPVLAGPAAATVDRHRARPGGLRGAHRAGRVPRASVWHGAGRFASSKTRIVRCAR